MYDKTTFFTIAVLASLVIPPIVGGMAIAVGHLVGMNKERLLVLFGTAVAATFGAIIALATLAASLFIAAPNAVPQGFLGVSKAVSYVSIPSIGIRSALLTIQGKEYGLEEEVKQKILHSEWSNHGGQGHLYTRARAAVHTGLSAKSFVQVNSQLGTVAGDHVPSDLECDIDYCDS